MGLEPTQGNPHTPLKRACLPISPLRHKNWLAKIVMFSALPDVKIRKVKKFLNFNIFELRRNMNVPKTRCLKF